MHLNWHHVISGLQQSLWLAGPGVVVGALLMAVAAMYVLELTFPQACVFGAILSATDPVAVVALLKTAGKCPQASKQYITHNNRRKSPVDNSHHWRKLSQRWFCDRVVRAVRTNCCQWQATDGGERSHLLPH